MSDEHATYSSAGRTMDSTTAVAAGRATVGAGQLHTPQEQVHDSFTHSEVPEKKTKSAPVNTLSPPTSPFDSAHTSFTDATSNEDPTLFPEATPSEQQAPLFESQEERAESTATKQSTSQSQAALPIRVPGTTVTIEPTREAAIKYYMDVMASNERMRAAQRVAGTLPFPSRSTGCQPRDEETTRQLGLLTRPAGVTKVRSPLKPVAKPVPKPKATKAAHTTPSREATPERSTSHAPHARRSRTPRQKQKKDLDFYNDAFPGENEKKHKRAAPSKHTASKDEDLRWRDLPDYAPPVSTLDDPTIKLRTSWAQTQSSLKIDEEGDADCLHPQELKLSETLRLRPVQYLANKRRIFEAKVRALQEKKQFTKTAAQNVTNIDVNKASRLWEAFDNVGWFQEKWFKGWLADDETKMKMG